MRFSARLLRQIYTPIAVLCQTILRRRLLITNLVSLLAILLCLTFTIALLSQTGWGVKAMERGHEWTAKMNSFVGQLTAAKKPAAANATITAAPPAFATLTVTNLNATGAGSLAAVIASAASGDTIVFQTGLTGTISPTSTYSISKNLTITGPGAGTISITGNNSRRVFTINPGFTVTISGLTITSGNNTGGAGIRNDGNLTLNNCTLSSNRASSLGGAIYNTGPLTLNGCTVTQNSTGSVGGGGGIYSTGAGSVTVTNCTFTNNSAPSVFGGAIYSANLTATSSTFSGNSAGSGGAIYLETTGSITDCVINGNTSNSAGGVFVRSSANTVTISGSQITNNIGYQGGGLNLGAGTITLDRTTVSGNSVAGGSSPLGAGMAISSAAVTLKNCTVSGNFGANIGGGIYASSGTVTSINSTVANNQATTNASPRGGGIYVSSSAGLSLKNTIIAGNTSPTGPDMNTSSFTSRGNNLIGNTANIGTGAVASDLLNVNPQLLPLGNYGGTVQTHLVPIGSPALNAGSDTTLAPDNLTTDARGAVRKVGTAVDIGAVENTITFEPAILPNGYTSSGYPITAITGGSNFSVISGTLPPTLALSTSGVLSGTPTTGGVYSFTVKATDTSGYQGAISYSVVINPLTISAQPVSLTRCPGTAASFSVTATGIGALTYQWRKNSTNISGANDSTYTIPAVATGDAGSYDVVVNDTNGAITSAAATLTVNPATVITVQPTSLAQCVGTMASFSVTATGMGALTYQWRKGGTPISGATTSTYTIPNIVSTDAGSYDVVVTGACNTVTSTAATLTINPTTAITTQPTSLTQCAGTTARFSVAATGAGLTYQWRKGTTPISGANDSFYEIAAVTSGDAGTNYNVVVTGSCGTTTSLNRTLTVTPATTITIQPTSLTRCVGASASFSVTATGTSPLTYQWRKNEAVIVGETSSTYSTIATVPANNTADRYDVVVTGACGTVTSTAATLTVNPATAITTQPVSLTKCEGTSASFSVAATGTGTLTYQWRKNSTNIPGATSSTYTIAAVTPGDVGNYNVVVTGLCSTRVSSSGTLAVTPATVITTQPAAESVTAGQAARFMTASSQASATVQWQVSINGGQFWTNLQGATSTSLIIATNASHHGNRYRAVFTNCGTTATTNDVLLTVAGGTDANTMGLVISEFRLRGSSTQPELDEYVELLNNTTTDITVTTSDGSAGWAIAALSADGNSATIVATLPNGTVIPAKAHRLIVNNSVNGYSLGGVATGDLSFTSDIADDTGLALFKTANPASFATNTVIDAVGFQLTGTAAALFREGTGLAPLGSNNGEYAWVRKLQNGLANDTNDNASDFVLVHPSRSVINGVTSQLGAPGPEKSDSPVEFNRFLFGTLFDLTAATTASPNQVRDLTAVTNGDFGTLVLRRSFTNNTGAPLKKLRFRVIDITNAASGAEADVRLLSSATAAINGQTVEGLTLEEPPAQTNGGGMNATVVVGTITGQPLAVGATVHVEFKLGVMRRGQYRFFLNIEAAQ